MAEYSIKGIDHVCLNTMNVDEVKDFYVKFFGFTVKTDFQGQTYRMVILKNGEFCLEIVNEEAAKAPGPFDHICFLVTGLKELVEELREAGCAIDEGPTDAVNADGILLYSMKFLTGPAGERIELYEKFRPDLYEQN